jgi:NAD(P)-dependent dehydrogenase (short-subunit alcohol dehydrogenase family)
MPNAKFYAQLKGALLAFALVLTAVPVLAKPSGVDVNQVHRGTTLKAMVDVPIRDRAPSGGALYIKGQRTGTLKDGDEIIVSDVQMFRTVLGNQKWVSFSRTGSRSGWVLVGNAGTTSGSFRTKS